jgi:hypothetical protein
VSTVSMLYKCGHVATFWPHMAAPAGHEAKNHWVLYRSRL